MRGAYRSGWTFPEHSVAAADARWLAEATQELARTVVTQEAGQFHAVKRKLATPHTLENQPRLRLHVASGGLALEVPEVGVGHVLMVAGTGH